MSEVSDEMQRSKHVALAFLAGAFLVGGSLGFTVNRVMDDRALARSEREATLDRFSEELDLTPEQRLAVDSIMVARQRVYDSIVAPVRPQIDSIRDRSRAMIATRLTAEQRARFDRYIERTKRQKEAERAAAARAK